ncbi:MAG: glycosyltransferase family 39 protein [Planctomycetia bacterium]|nr:glycosyltransferase family 39 protein [Planctomycetia bacterium]
MLPMIPTDYSDSRPSPAVGIRPSHRGLAVAGGLVAILGFALLNLAYLSVSPLDLAPDEAHYWDWSRRLDWSYYSKGPMVAWLIRASCSLLGDTAFAVRVPAVLCNALMLVAVFLLARRTLDSDRLALAALGLGMVLPPLSAGAVLTTIDAPFLCCWSWALLGVHRAVFDNDRRVWIAAGVAVALGTLTKYTMLAFPALAAVWLVASRFEPRHLRDVARMAAIGSLGLVPILIWNWHQDWIGVRHLFGQAGLATGPKIGFKPLGPLDYLAGQFAFLGGYWFCAFALAAWTFRPSRDRQLTFLWWYSVPLVLIFVPFSLRVKIQPNWPAAAYLAGFLLAFAWLRRDWFSEPSRYRSLVRALFAIGVGASVALSIAARFPQLMLPVFASIVPEPTGDRLAPVRNLDPTARLRGWRHLAAEVDVLRDRIAREDGQTAELATMTWTVPGELAFYCRGNPTVYSFGTALNDRYSQYDLWRPNPIADAQAFAGRTFVYVGEKLPEGIDAFDSLAGPFRVEYRENGVVVGGWKLWVARGYRGFPDPQPKRPQY